jgi:hypothetical protein
MKSSGYDLITGKILEELPIIGKKYLTQLFNAGTMESRIDHLHFEASKTS